MHDESPPEKSRKTGGEFTWPPTREELDAIEVIRLDDTSSIEPRAGVVPAKVKAITAPALGRRGRLRLPRRLPRRDDLVFAGAIGTSVLAIAVAASMQFSDLWRPAPEPQAPPIPPLIGQTLPAFSPIVMSPVASAPVATRQVEHRRVSPRRAAKHVRRTALVKHTAIARPAVRPARAEDYTRPRLIAPDGGRSGKIVLNVEVRKNGKVGDVDVLSSDLDRKNRSHRDLQRAAVSAVKRWRYTPAVRDGAPAGTHVRVVVDINLDSERVSFTEAAARRRAAAANRAVDNVLAAR